MMMMTMMKKKTMMGRVLIIMIIIMVELFITIKIVTIILNTKYIFKSNLMLTLSVL